jgi:hypothetical protein
MIKHIVMWKLHETANGNTKSVNAQLIKEKIESLRGKIPGLLKVEVGLNYKSSDHALYFIQNLIVGNRKKVIKSTPST